MLCDWDVQTYEYWVETLERERLDAMLPKSGLRVRVFVLMLTMRCMLMSSLQMQEAHCYWDHQPDEELWWAPHVQDFRQLTPFREPVSTINSKTAQDGPEIKWAVTYRSISINVPHYLLYLQEKARRLGVEVIKAQLPIDAGLEKALSAAESTATANGRPAADCFLNASGLGAAKLCNDKTMYPIRGQTVLVKGEANTDRMRHGGPYTAYCIPRPGSGTTILGGTREKGVWSEEPDPKVTEQILRNNSYMVPELLIAADGGFEVISVQCGLRPGREGGPRMERELVGGRKVVHAYGHAGSGYQNSVGSARLVVRLVTESVGGSQIFSRL